MITSIPDSRSGVDVESRFAAARLAHPEFVGAPLIVTERGSVIFGAPLSLSYALERIVPMLAVALDGDPATTVVPR
ncbi:MAG: hypothetical protein ACRDTJ_08385 [Pseudonocardiaceae bacterium]